jgi:hypothetical protein
MVVVNNLANNPMKLKMNDALTTTSSSSFFNDKEPSNLLRTSNTPNTAATQEFNQCELLKHFVLGEQDKAETLIKAHPKWLLNKYLAQDYSGRTIIATPFQAAIGAGDKPMWEMILRYLEPLEALRQFREWFPNGIEEETSAKTLQVGYNAIVLEIIKGQTHGQAAISGFRDQITAQKEIRQGRHFNLNHLSAAYQAYIDNFDVLSSWENRDLFWNQVIGYVQRQMTAYDAQIYCSGVKKVLENPVAFSRALILANDCEFFPTSISSGVGFDFGVYSCHGSKGFWQSQGGVPVVVAKEADGLKIYVEQKQMELQDLESHLSKECSITPNNRS